LYTQVTHAIFPQLNLSSLRQQKLNNTMINMAINTWNARAAAVK